MTEHMKSLVKAVRIYATMNYNKDGWDYLVESMEDCEIEEDLIGGPGEERCTTNMEAINRMRGICKLLDERRKDIRGHMDESC